MSCPYNESNLHRLLLQAPVPASRTSGTAFFDADGNVGEIGYENIANEQFISLNVALREEVRRFLEASRSRALKAQEKAPGVLAAARVKDRHNALLKRFQQFLNYATRIVLEGERQIQILTTLLNNNNDDDDDGGENAERTNGTTYEQLLKAKMRKRRVQSVRDRVRRLRDLLRTTLQQARDTSVFAFAAAAPGVTDVPLPAPIFLNESLVNLPLSDEVAESIFARQRRDLLQQTRALALTRSPVKVVTS